MFKTVKIESDNSDLEKIEKLYIQSFPENERSPLALLTNDHSNSSVIYAFYEDEIFVGFISLLNYQDISHIIYFAIAENMRAKGYGTKVLKTLKELLPRQRILADIESPLAIPSQERSKRKEFYLRNGYICSEVKYEWRDEFYEILVYGGNITEKEFWDFWDNISKINENFMRF